MNRYPDTLETLTTLRTWTPSRVGHAVLAVEKGKLYLMGQTHHPRPHMLTDLESMYPDARFIVLEIEAHLNLPMPTAANGGK